MPECCVAWGALLPSEGGRSFSRWTRSSLECAQSPSEAGARLQTLPESPEASCAGTRVLWGRRADSGRWCLG